ncbi:MAG: hydrogenase iron-sulfur subunit [Peptococcaceae bacterium]|jgi:coenzyme F420-reducing hydrogenase delta subunit|nr:hydrogenase iron-sulfur subunit [Peptococcaceae bacterium]
MAAAKEGREISPRILVFSTNNISDPGIDLAGSSHMHYPSTVVVITMPCSSGVKPEWILYAVEKGFDGIFLATDGEECSYLPDCAERTAHIAQEAKDLLIKNGYEPRRVRMSGICSVCAEPFTNHMKEFSEVLRKLGPAGKG